MHLARRPWLVLLALAALALACAAAPPPLDPSQLARLREPPASHGELVYAGEVVPLGETVPAFRYVRRVTAGAGETQISTHLTTPAASDEVVVLQRATHRADGTLVRYEELHAQIGTEASVHAHDDGSLTFTVRRGGSTEVRREGAGAPVVVGPTLFAFVRANLEALRSGAELPVRFAAADRGESFGFTLRAIRISARRTTVEMAASDLFVRLGIDAMRIEVDHVEGRVLSYRGRVPPRRDGTESFDAEVRYQYEMPRFR